jgi:hypothetical protein
MDRRRMGAVWGIASTWAAAAGADVAPRALARVARTQESRCASPVCQHVTEDTEPSAAVGASDEPPPFSLALGVGAAWLRHRVQDPIIVNIPTLPEDFPSSSATDGGVDGPPGSDGAPIDDGVWLGPLSETTYRDEKVAAYPTLSLTLDLQQPLVALGSVNLRLAERFSVSAAPRVPGEDLSMLGGFADIVLGARASGFPVQAGVGPTLGVIDVRGIDFGWGESVLVGVVGIVRVEVPGVPGTLDAVVRGTRLLASSPEAGSYRDAQLAYTFPL